MLITKVFQTEDDQAVRIPNEMQTNLTELTICKVGDGYILFPSDDPWFPLCPSIVQMPDDFMSDREQPSWDDVSEIDSPRVIK